MEKDGQDMDPMQRLKKTRGANKSRMINGVMMSKLNEEKH